MPLLLALVLLLVAAAPAGADTSASQTLAAEHGRLDAGSLTATLRGTAGRSTHRLPRRLTGRRLRPGLYRLEVEAGGARVTQSFRVPR